MRKTVLVVALLWGLLAAVVGPGVGVLLLLFGARTGGAGRSGLQGTTIALAIVALGLVLGLPLAVHAWRALREAPGGPFRLPGWGWFLALTLIVVIAGQSLYTVGATVTIPFLHLLAGALPALLFLSLVAEAGRRGGETVSGRLAIGSVAWGGLGSSLLAILLEALGAVAVLFAAMVWLNAAQPELAAQIQAWAQGQAANPGRVDLGPLAGLIRSPALVLMVLAAMSVGAPLIEETAKSLAVPLAAATGRRLSRLDGFLLGAAAGAGFTMFEGIMNGSLSLAGAGSSWSSVMLARGGTAAVHVVASGLAGLGWQAILTERRWGRGLGFWLASLVVHGLWNLAAGSMALTALLGSDPGQRTLAGGIGLIAAVLMGAIWLLAVTLLPLMGRRLARRPQSAPNSVTLSTGEAENVQDS